MLPKYGGGEEGVTVDSFFIGYPYEFDITMITMAGHRPSIRPVRSLAMLGLRVVGRG